jgi:hypothetical protein
MTDQDNKALHVTAEHDGRRVTQRDVYTKDSTPLPVPVREIDTLESITLGFRQNMFDLSDKDGNGGSVSTSAGLGGEAIILSYQDGDTERQAVIRGSELLIAWVQTFDPKVATLMRKATDLAR